VPGQIRRCRVAELAEPAALSSHALSLVQAFDLGQALGRLPEHLVLFMVDVTDTGDGVGCPTPRRPPCPQPSRWCRQTYTVGGAESRSPFVDEIAWVLFCKGERQVPEKKGLRSLSRETPARHCGGDTQCELSRASDSGYECILPGRRDDPDRPFAGHSRTVGAQLAAVALAGRRRACICPPIPQCTSNTAIPR
jgi:hypothetical protein